jgi:hypothetical protein
VEKVTRDEESHTYDSSSVQLPVAFRSALKMAFLHAGRFRDVVLVTQDQELQQLARQHQLLSLDAAAFAEYVVRLAKQPAAPPMALASPALLSSSGSLAPSMGVASPALLSSAGSLSSSTGLASSFDGQQRSQATVPASNTSS